MSEGGYASIIVIILVLLGCGAGYIGTAYSYKQKFTGILSEANVLTVTSCNKGSCSNTYYVNEVFLKGYNETNTCTVKRLYGYYSYGDAENKVLHTIKNSKRTLYQTYDAGTCYDEKIKQYYSIIGFVLFSLGAFLPVGAILLYICLSFEHLLETKRFTEISNSFHNTMINIHNTFVNIGKCCYTRVEVPQRDVVELTIL